MVSGNDAWVNVIITPEMIIGVKRPVSMKLGYVFITPLLERAVVLAATWYARWAKVLANIQLQVF